MGDTVARTPRGALEIDCARRDARGRVTHVSGPGPDGRRWSAPLDAVIAAAMRDDGRYFVSRGAQQLGLQVKNGELVAMIDDGWSVSRLPACPEGR